MALRDIAVVALLVMNMFIGYFAYSNYVAETATNSAVERLAGQLGEIVGRAQACEIADPNVERFMVQVMRNKGLNTPGVEPKALTTRFTKEAAFNKGNVDVDCRKVSTQYLRALEIIASKTQYTYTGVKRMVKDLPDS